MFAMVKKQPETLVLTLNTNKKNKKIVDNLSLASHFRTFKLDFVHFFTARGRLQS